MTVLLSADQRERLEPAATLGDRFVPRLPSSVIEPVLDSGQVTNWRRVVVEFRASESPMYGLVWDRVLADALRGEEED